MAGLRERKKEQTRRRITAEALRLFAERGFDGVSVNEIAEAAEVAKATFFAYFPGKEALVLQGVGEEDLAGIVARRPPGRPPLQALRASCRTFAEEAAETDWTEMVTRMRVIFDSPALSGAANALLYRRRWELARELVQEYGQAAAALAAAQIAATVLTLQETFFLHLIGGAPPREAARTLARDTELAFDLLEHGIPHGREK
ncbi:TetR family transcriptional regulator [Actinocorallia libanotica]|uniref:HTH tetR-type domain-containing protein n=1 Tax=Actinocorallia libanotica TaxID=46162 RepID=A0ABP4CB53_9ACTN